MKITQTETQLQLVDSGITNLVVSIGMVIGGLLFSVAILTGSLKSSDGKATPVWLAGISLLVSALGVFIALKAQKKTIILNKSGPSSITTKKLLGGEVSNTALDIQNVKAIELRVTATQNVDSDGRRRSQMQSFVSMRLQDNSLIDLASTTKSGSIALSFGTFSSNNFQKAPLSKEAKQVSDFLGVPLNVADGNDPQQLVNTVVEAITPNTVANPSTLDADKKG
ncbi:MAG: hypothetical protein WCO19_01000 [Candidatus Saccharibacteria bacterium]